MINVEDFHSVEVDGNEYLVTTLVGFDMFKGKFYTFEVEIDGQIKKLKSKVDADIIETIYYFVNSLDKEQYLKSILTDEFAIQIKEYLKN